MENPLEMVLAGDIPISGDVMISPMVVPRGDKNWGNIIDEVEDMSQQVGSA